MDNFTYSGKGVKTLNSFLSKFSFTSIATFFGFLVSVLTILALVAPSAFSQSKRLIMFDIVSKTTLVGPVGSIDGLQIAINEKPIKEAYLYLIKLSNMGSEPIAVRDYEKPIEIKFTGEIFSVKEAGKTPSNLSLEFSVKNGVILINPFLFNPGEDFSLQVVSTTNNKPTAQSRISGISEIEVSIPSEKPTKRMILTLISCFFLLIFYAKALYLSAIKIVEKNQAIRKSNIVVGVVCGLSSTLLLTSVFNREADKWSIYLFLVLPIVFGVLLGRSEYKSIVRSRT